MIDTILQSLKLTVYGLQHTIIECIYLIVDSIDFISKFIAQILQTLHRFNFCRLETSGIGHQTTPKFGLINLTSFFRILNITKLALITQISLVLDLPTFFKLFQRLKSTLIINRGSIDFIRTDLLNRRIFSVIARLEQNPLWNWCLEIAITVTVIEIRQVIVANSISRSSVVGRLRIVIEIAEVIIKFAGSRLSLSAFGAAAALTADIFGWGSREERLLLKEGQEIGVCGTHGQLNFIIDMQQLANKSYIIINSSQPTLAQPAITTNSINLKLSLSDWWSFSAFLTFIKYLTVHIASLLEDDDCSINNLNFALISSTKSIIIITAMQSSRPSTVSSIDYFTNFQLFASQDAQLLCSYKHFIESVIMKLGEDWRIESSLFVQEITALPIQSRDMSDFNLFNQFLSAFLKRKLGREYEYAKYSESQIQDSFLDEVANLFQEQSIRGSLTFKTLSLGYCITANDVWNKIFKNSPQKNTRKIQIFKPLGKLKLVQSKQNEKSNMQDLGTVSSRLQEDKIEESAKDKEARIGVEQQQLSKQSQWEWSSFEKDEISQSKVNQIREILSKISHDTSKSQMLSYFVCFVDQIRTSSSTARICSLCKDFYMNAFTIWLIFSIKMYFSLNSADYLRYCRELMSGWKLQYEKPLRAFQGMLQREWNKLMKDYRVALHDDLEVLNMLIERVRKEMQNEWEAKISLMTQTFSLAI